MSFEYKSINFISTPISTDTRIRIYDKNYNLKHSIEPEFSYAYTRNNCIIIKITNNNDITLSFENKNDANLAMIKFLEVLSFFRDR